jgi:hypothetical protein
MFDLELPIEDEAGNPMAINIGGTSLDPLRFLMRPKRYIINKKGIVPSALGIGDKGFKQSMVDYIWGHFAFVPFSAQTLVNWGMQDGYDPKTGDTTLPLAMMRALAEFGGFPTTFRTGKSKEAKFTDFFDLNANPWEYSSGQPVERN